MNKHEDTVKGLEFALDYRAAEAYTINQKLEHIQEQFDHADKKGEKLMKKRNKLNNEKEINNWDNQELLGKISEDQIKKLLSSDKDACMDLILPKEQHSIDDLKVLGAYLTESLIQEMGRVKSQIALEDMVNEFKKFNFSLRDNLKETLQVTDLLDRKLK